MFLEIYYKEDILQVGNSKIPKIINSFISKKKNHLTVKTGTLFEEHKDLKLNNKAWTTRKYWNFFCWFFNLKYLKNNDKQLDKKTAQIVFWDMIGQYKAWRHVRGYPVNGQRTWSNANSCSKNNTNLRFYRLKQMQNAFGVKKQTNYVQLVQAEAVNKLWLHTWPSEWIQGYRHAIRSKSRKGTTIPIDLTNLAKAVTTGYYRRGQAEKWNKSKKALKTVTIGLPIFFSRFFFGLVKKKYFKYQLVLAQPDFKKSPIRKKQSNQNKVTKKKTKKK